MALRILHVAQISDPGGVSRYVDDLVADQVQRGWMVAVACPPVGSLGPAVERLGAEHRPWDAAREPARGLVGEWRALQRIVREVWPEVVHLHSSKAGLVGRCVVRRRRPTLFSPHGWSFLAVTGASRRAAVMWERVGAHLADVVVCGSEGERRTGEAFRIHARWRVVPNATDVERYVPLDDEARRGARADLGIGPGPLVVCIGRLCEQKGQDLLLAAWPAVCRAVPGARLALVGDGPLRAGLEAGAGPAVVFAGYQRDVRPWLAAADVVVQPSRYEGLSLVTLEALASARSVVATDVEGMREAIGDDAGAVVPPGDRHALAAALVTRLRDRERTAAEGRAGRTRVERRFSLRSWGDAMAAVTEECADRAARSRLGRTASRDRRRAG